MASTSASVAPAAAAVVAEPGARSLAQHAGPQDRAAAAAQPLPSLALHPRGRPPLPRSASASSSRASSPRSLSAQPSLRTLNMNRQAQYKAAARTFKPDTAPRKGLGTGDVVALRMQGGGGLLAATEMGGDPSDASTVHFGFQPSATADASDKLTHLEVIRQGKWLGFRCAAAGDRFLQARKRSTPCRLVFFSQNVGTWEQWELGTAGPDPDAADWSSLGVTLRHRRLPQYELAVQLERVGVVSLPPNASVTPRSLLAGEQPASAPAGSAGSVGGADEDLQLERRELQRMSGVLVHEWLHFVDQEKAARLAIEARVAQLTEDAAGLRDWAVMQVGSVRQEMSAEVQQLLDVVQRKSAALALAESRLSARLRWGVAVMQAKREAAVLRQAFMWWRWHAARKQQCRAIEAKLAQRSALRLQARALAAWVEWREQQVARQSTLRAAVRRMSFVRLYHAFTAWQDLAVQRRQQQEDSEAQLDAVCQHMQRWRLRRLLRSWQQRAAGCSRGREALQRMAVQSDRRAAAAAFSAWRTGVEHRRERLASLTALVATRQVQRTQQAAFQAWRLATEDRHGERLQEAHAAQVLGRLRARAVLHAWLAWQQERVDRRARWEATIAYMRQRGQVMRLDVAFCAWREHVAEQREQRALFYGVVQHLALRKMSVGFRAWRYVVAYRRHARASVEESVARLAQRTQATAWAAWQECVAQRRVERHRVAVCQRRSALGAQRAALAAWRQVAAAKAAERQVVSLCQRRADRIRMALALGALRGNAECAVYKREQEHLAVACATQQLQARAFAALVAAVARRRLFEQQLAAGAAAMQRVALQEVFSSWCTAVALDTAESQLMAAARRRTARQRLQNRFAAWRAAAEEARQERGRLQRLQRQQSERLLGAAFAGWQVAVQQRRKQQQRLQAGVALVAQLRTSWAFDVWRQHTAEALAERQLVARAQRRIARIRLAAVLGGWRQQTAELAKARAVAMQRSQQHDAALVQQCLLGWADVAAERAQQREAVVALVQRRAAWMSFSVLHHWRAFLQHKQARRAQLQRAVRRLGMLRQRSAFAAWRQHVEERRADDARLAVAEGRVAARHAATAVRAVFSAWRGHAATLAAARAAVEAKVAAEGAVLRRHVLASWHSATAVAEDRREHLLRVCVAQRAAGLQSRALAAWELHAQRQARNREAVEVMVHRMARRVMHAALLSWQVAAQERRVRRIAIARFIQRWDAHRKAAALSHWRHLLAERREAAENLKRCLTRKRVAFRLFRQWYWESFDEDMQETLRTMFEVTEEAALDPMPSRGGSPYGSLLSSPIRQQLYGMGRQQQLQLTSGVAEALGRPGGMRPAFFNGSDARQDSGSLGSLGLPALPPRESLSSRLAAAESNGVAAARASLGGGDQWGSFTLHTNVMLETVPEAGESPWRSPAPRHSPHAGHSPTAGAQSNGNASSTASTAIPTSPLTPASAYAAGGTPLSGISRLPTPADLAAAAAALQQQHFSPGGLSAAPTPGGLGGALSDAPTPGAFGPLSAQRGSPLAGLTSPLSFAGTPQPDFNQLSPSAAGYAGLSPSAAASFDLWPAAAARLANAPTPGADGQTQFEVRRFSDGTEYVAAVSPAAPARAASEYGTTLGVQKTPPPGLLQLQGDYSIRRLDEEGRRLAAEATPAAGSGFIAAFPPGSMRGAPNPLAQGGGEEGLSAAKTPLLHVNPLAL